MKLNTLAHWMKKEWGITYHHDNPPPAICTTIIEVLSFLADLLELGRKALTRLTREQAKALILKVRLPTSTPNPVLASTTMTTTTKEEPTTEEQVLKQYHRYLDIFTKPVAGQLPPHHK